MQNSAISFSICLDNKEDKIAEFILDLSDEFEIRYNENLELITIRHYNDEIIERMTKERKIFLEQKSRATVQYLVK
jgi:aspartate kinase